MTKFGVGRYEPARTAEPGRTLTAQGPAPPGGIFLGAAGSRSQ